MKQKKKLWLIVADSFIDALIFVLKDIRIDGWN